MKPKCPKCGSTKLDTDIPRMHVGCMDCGWWSRRIAKAAIIRLAVEPKKPETCKWKRGRATDKAECGRWKYRQGHCGKPVEVEG